MCLVVGVARFSVAAAAAAAAAECPAFLMTDALARVFLIAFICSVIRFGGACIFAR